MTDRRPDEAHRDDAERGAAAARQVTQREQLLGAFGEDLVLRLLAWEPYEPQASFLSSYRDNAIVAEVVPGQANVQVLVVADEVEWEVCGSGGRAPLAQARERLSRAVAAMRPDLAVHVPGLDGKDFLTEVREALDTETDWLTGGWRSRIERLLDAYASAAAGLRHYRDTAERAERERLRYAGAAELIKKERDGAVGRQRKLEDAIAQAKVILGAREGRGLCETARARMEERAAAVQSERVVREALQAGLDTDEDSVRALAVAACAVLRGIHAGAEDDAEAAR